MSMITSSASASSSVPTISLSPNAVVNSELGAATRAALKNELFRQVNGRWPAATCLNHLPSESMVSTGSLEEVGNCVKNSSRHFQAIIALLMTVEYVRVMDFYRNRKAAYIPGIVFRGNNYYTPARAEIEKARNHEERGKISEFCSFVLKNISQFESFVNKLKEARENLTSIITCSEVIKKFPLLDQSIQLINEERRGAVTQCEKMLKVYQVALDTLKTRAIKISVVSPQTLKEVSFKHIDDISIPKYTKIFSGEVSPHNVDTLITPYQERIDKIEGLLNSLFSLCAVYNVILFDRDLQNNSVMSRNIEQINPFLKTMDALKAYVESFYNEVKNFQDTLAKVSLDNSMNDLSRTDSAKYILNLNALSDSLRDIMTDINVINDTISDRRQLIERELSQRKVT